MGLISGLYPVVFNVCRDEVNSVKENTLQRHRDNACAVISYIHTSSHPWDYYQEKNSIIQRYYYKLTSSSTEYQEYIPPTHEGISGNVPINVEIHSINLEPHREWHQRPDTYPSSWPCLPSVEAFVWGKPTLHRLYSMDTNISFYVAKIILLEHEKLFLRYQFVGFHFHFAPYFREINDNR